VVGEFSGDFVNGRPWNKEQSIKVWDDLGPVAGFFSSTNDFMGTSNAHVVNIYGICCH